MMNVFPNILALAVAVIALACGSINGPLQAGDGSGKPRAVAPDAATATPDTAPTDTVATDSALPDQVAPSEAAVPADGADSAAVSSDAGSSLDVRSEPDAGVEVGPVPLPGVPRHAVLLFDEAHQGWGLTQGIWARFAADLTGDGHTVRAQTSGQITQPLLSGVDVLVIPTSWGAYSPAELTTIRQFVNDGGRLFITGVGWSWVDPAMSRTLDNFPVNQVATMFGIKFLDGYLCDPTDHDKVQNQPLFSPARSHIILNDIKTIGGGVAPCPLQAIDPTVEVILAGDADSYDTRQVYRPGDRPPLLLSTQYGGGRVLALGHEGYFASIDTDMDGVANIDEYDNRRLGRNIIQFLAGYR